MHEPRLEDRLHQFQAKLLQLKQQMRAGLHRRASALRAAAFDLDRGNPSARTSIKSQAHRIRGIAGTYGYSRLSELARELEERISLAPEAAIIELTGELAALAEATGIDQALVADPAAF